MQPHAAAAAAVLGSLIALGAVSVAEGSGPALDPGLNASKEEFQTSKTIQNKP